MLLLGFATSIFMEITSDIQKTMWINNGRVGGFCTVGWWEYSRHPNYAGEILQWWFVSLLCIISFPTSVLSYGSLISPVFTMQILLTLSGTGICHAEGKNLKRYYDNPQYGKAYEEYRNTTSPLFPIPSLIYGSMPLSVKRRYLFEWERYEYKPSSKKE
jgi:steroid 5-alpha reductase family enzyme